MTRGEDGIRSSGSCSDQGIADIKGAVSEIARQLCLSESTVYRCLALKSN